MNLLDQFDAMRMDSENDDDNSEQETNQEQKLVVNFDLNYDIRGGSDNSGDDSQHLQFDHRNDDADSDGDMEAVEKAHMAMLKRDSDLLDDKDILEMQAAQSILESCGLTSSGTSKQHNFRPSGMSLGFVEAVGGSSSNNRLKEDLSDQESSEQQVNEDDDDKEEQDSVTRTKEEEDNKNDEASVSDFNKNYSNNCDGKDETKVLKSGDSELVKDVT